MFNKLKIFTMGFLTACVLMLSTGVFAQDIYQSISVVFDAIKVVVNGENKQVSNLVYNGSTYIKLRDLSNVFGKEVEWDAGTGTAYIDEKGAVKLTGSNPRNALNGYYPRYDYLQLDFNVDMKELTDISNVSLTSESGKKVTITRVSPGTTYKKCLLPIFTGDLELNTLYELFIPGNTVESVDGKRYLRDISIKFKTPETVVRGRVVSNANLSGATLIIDDLSKTTVNSDGTYVINIINGGNHTIKILTADKKSYEQKIVVEAGMLNKLNFYADFK